MLYLYFIGVFFSPTSSFTSLHIFDEFNTFIPIHFSRAESLLVTNNVLNHIKLNSINARVVDGSVTRFDEAGSSMGESSDQAV